jgi:hypothetical protein
MRRLGILCVALSILGFVLVPAEAKPRKAITSFKKLGAGETVVVGRVELVPPLHEHEQRVRGPMSKKYRNKMFLVIDDEYWELTEEPGWGDFKGRIDAPFGEEFMVRSSTEPFYVIAGMMILTMGHGSATDNAYFPGGLKADIRPGDRAVYVGTIRYHRNEFFEVTDAEIVDDYARVRVEFEAQFGKQHPLRKALLRPVK